MFQIPSLGDLVTRARQSYRAYLPGSDAWIWPNNIYASAKVMAGLTFEVFGYADYISKQKFAVTAPDLESLLLHGEEFGIPRKPAAPASGNIKFTSGGAITVDTNAILRRTDGVQYRVASGGSLTSAGVLIVAAIAVADGKASNAGAGTPLEVVSGLTGDALAEVGVDGIVLGADVEDIESYRARILFRKRNPPHGGSAADYVLWALQVAGVTRVFVERLWNGCGTVRVYVLMDDLFPNGIPDAASIIRVKDFIVTVMPAGTILTVAAPVAHPINVTISGLSPDTAAVRTAVLAELQDTFFRRGRVAGGDTFHGGMPLLASPAVFSRSWIWQAIANATGEDSHILTAPAADVTLAIGEIATLGTVTFV